MTTAPVAHSESVPESLTKLVMSHLREIPDFPEPGVLFRDITPLLADGQAFAALVEGLADHYRGRIDAIAGLESRGFILAAPLARRPHALRPGYLRALRRHHPDAELLVLRVDRAGSPPLATTAANAAASSHGRLGVLRYQAEYR